MIKSRIFECEFVSVSRSSLLSTATSQAAVLMAFWLLLLNGALASAQQRREAYYFANDRVRTVKLVERKEILEYRVEPLAERRYRETFFDSDGLTLFQRSMYYRVKESFDGKVQLEFDGGLKPAGPNHSIPLPASKLLAVREGRLEEIADLTKNLSLPTGQDLRHIQLVAEYERHSVALTRTGRAEFIASLLVGKLEGYSGRKLRKEFWALEVEGVGGPNASESSEGKRIRDFLIDELKFQTKAKSLYAYGVEKAVLLRPNERLLEPVNFLGGSRGKAPDQFDEPDAVAFTLDGRLIAADTENARFKIYRFDGNSQSLQIVGREGTAAGEFGHGLVLKTRGLTVYHQIQGIAVDKNGLIFAIDQGNQRIQVFEPDGRVLPDKAIPLQYCPAETPRCEGAIGRALKGQYTSLQGLAIDQDGAVFVSDSGTSRIYRYLANGKLDTNFTIPALHPRTQQPLLKEPESMALYHDKLFIASEGTGDIRIFDRKSGAPIEPVSFGADVFAGDAEGIAVLNDYLFAVDVQNSRIAVFDLRQTPPKFLMGFVGDFESADGIAVDPKGKYVAVADQGNLRIVVFSLPEIMKHLASANAR
jgi:sugar lactone lactonase YvrE